MDEVLASALQGAVFGQLDYLDHLARDGDEQSKAALADTEICRLTGAVRAILADHAPDEQGKCRVCRAMPWRRRARCTVWGAAYSHLASDPASRAGPRGRHSLRSSHAAIT